MFGVFRRRLSAGLVVAGALMANGLARSEPAPAVQPSAQAGPPSTLLQAFETAWAVQPAAASRVARLDAALAAQRAAATGTAGPAALVVSTRTDRVGSDVGAREHEVGVVAPLWLPGERQRAARLADAQLESVDARVAAARLRLAAAVRDAWWGLQRAELEHDLAVDRLEGARRLNADVQKRLRAGELSRADQFQAEGAVAQAEVALADALAARSAARQALAALVGTSLQDAPLAPTLRAEPEPAASPAQELDTTHPALAELVVLSERSRRIADLASVQRRANPEVALSATTDRGAFGDAYRSSVVVGIRVPFDAGPRAQARIASARADADEFAAQLGVERSRVLADIESSTARLQTVRAQLSAAERRAALARDVRGFIEKSFRLGESDLPTRLRVELEAVEAERQAARARVAVATAVSALRQSLGLLPE